MAFILHVSCVFVLAAARFFPLTALFYVRVLDEVNCNPSLLGPFGFCRVFTPLVYRGRVPIYLVQNPNITVMQPQKLIVSKQRRKKQRTKKKLRAHHKTNRAATQTTLASVIKATQYHCNHPREHVESPLQKPSANTQNAIPEYTQKNFGREEMPHKRPQKLTAGAQKCHSRGHRDDPRARRKATQKVDGQLI